MFLYVHKPISAELQIPLNLESKTANTRKVKRKELEGERLKGEKYVKSGHSFGAANPYGKRQTGDKRQFIRT
jgi:ATP-dependent RNA helicase DDX18/HAS1